MTTNDDNLADVADNQFSNSDTAYDFQAERSSPDIARPEAKENNFNLSKQFRCQNVYPYDRNYIQSEARTISGKGVLRSSDLSLIPTLDCMLAHRSEKLKMIENNNRYPLDDHVVLHIINNGRAIEKNSEKCEHQKRDDRVTNFQNSESTNRLFEATLSTKDVIMASNNPVSAISLIPSGRDRFARKLQRLKETSSEENKVPYRKIDLKNIENNGDDSSVTHSIDSAGHVIVELSIEALETPKIEIPELPAPIIMETIGSYVNDRKLWNSIASLNRETYVISKNRKKLYRPWPSLRWRVTTSIANAGGPAESLFREQHRRRRNARGAVQTAARPRAVTFGKDYLGYGTDRGDVLLRRVYGDGSTQAHRGHNGCVNSVKCYENWLISAGDDLDTRIWNVTTMSCEAILDGHDDSITSVDILPFNQYSISGNGRKGNAWRPSPSPPPCILVATAGLDGYIHLYTVYCEGNKVARTEHFATFAEELHPKPVYSIVLYEKDGHRSLVSGGDDGKLRLWDVDAAMDGDIEGHPNRIYNSTCIYRYDGEIKTIAISRDKERIAAAFGRTICHSALSVKTLRNYNFLHHHDHNHRHRRRLEQQRRLRSQSSSNNNHEALSSDTEDDHWKVLRGHSGDIRCIEFSPDGTTIASACSDGSIRLWRLGEGTWKRKWKAHNGFMVCSLAVSPDGQSLLSAGSDGTIAIEGLFS